VRFILLGLSNEESIPPRFSFRHLDLHSDDDFCFDHCEEGCLEKFLIKLKDLCTLSVKKFRTNKSKSTRADEIEWSDTQRLEIHFVKLAVTGKRGLAIPDNRERTWAGSWSLFSALRSATQLRSSGNTATTYCAGERGDKQVLFLQTSRTSSPLSRLLKSKSAGSFEPAP
jgi:hypothetical protein